MSKIRIRIRSKSKSKIRIRSKSKIRIKIRMRTSRTAVKVPLTGWLDSSILWPGQPGAGQRSNRSS